MRKLGLDVGDKTIGVAVSDELDITAQGVTTIDRVGIRKDAGKVMDYVREYDCDTVVMGLPINLDAPTAYRPRRYVNSEPCWRTRCAVPEWLTSRWNGRMSVLPPLLPNGC